MADPDANYSRFYTTESDKMSCKNYLLNNSAEVKHLSNKRKEKDDYYNEEENDPAYVFFLSCLKGHGMSYILEGDDKGLPVSIKYEDDSGSDEVCDEEENDPAYMSFFSCLKGHEMSYILKGEEKGLPVSIKYEVDSGSDEVCDLEPRRTLRSSMKPNKDSGSDKVCDLQPRRTLRSAMKQNKDSGSDKVCDLQPRRTLRSAMKRNKDSGSDEVCDLQPRRTLRSAMKRNKDSGSDEVCDLRTLRSAMKRNKDSGSDEVCDLEPKRTLRSASKQNKKSGSDEVCDSEPRRILRSATKQIKVSGLDEECDLEPRTILKSAMEKKKVSFNKKPLVENRKKIEMVNGRQPRSKCKSEKKRKVRSSNRNMEPDPDYLIFQRNLKVYDDSLVYNNGNHTVVYGMTIGKNSRVKEEEDNDGSFSGVTFLGCSLSEENLNFPMINDRLDIMDATSRCDYDFRQKVIAVLRKPYDEEEYDRLWQDIGRRKALRGRLDLRQVQGRERLCSLTKEGKSYLDHYPGLEIKLLKARDDKPKCLNYLRAFFCWLKLPGPFCPWEDAECTAIISESN